MIDRTLSHFRIRRKIGQGGMGEVFEAEDLELRRRVALKVLRRDVLDQPDRRARFVREAQTAARVTHPHIATVYEIGAAGDETFIAMEYVDGKTLRALGAGRALGVEEALRLAVQMSEGLAAAHDAQVLHRDLKPENVMVGTDGRVRILDFGLAKALDPPDAAAPEPTAGGDAGGDTVALSGDGRILGTVEYMSPEQARGLPLDLRSDIFSFGVTLYEMVTGRVAFHGDTPTDTLARILRDQPSPTAELNPDVPPELVRIIDKCLEKKPEDRYQHAGDLVVDLRRLLRDSDGAAVSSGAAEPVPARPGRPPRGRPRRAVAVAGIAVLAAAGLIGTRLLSTGGGADAPAPLANSLAVMPFHNLADGADPQRLGQILQELVITDLSGSPSLQVFSSQRLFDVQKRLGTDAPVFDRDTATRIARTVGAQTALEGTISQLGDRWILTATMIDVGAGTVVGSCRVDGADLYEMVDDLSAHLREEPHFALAGDSGSGDVKAKTSSSLDAYRLYLVGSDLLNAERYAAAADTLTRVVEMDPTFGKAHYKQAMALWWAASTRDLAGHGDAGPEVPLRRLLEEKLYSNRQERLMAEAARALVAREWEPSRTLYEQVTELYPDEKEGWYGLGEARFHSGTTPDQETLDAFERAVELDPSFTLAYKHIFDCNARLGRIRESLERVQAYRRANPGSETGARWWAEVAHQLGDPAEMESALAAAREEIRDNGRWARTLTACAQASLARGDLARSERLLEDSREADPDGRDPQWLAAAARLAGERHDFEELDTVLAEFQESYPDLISSSYATLAEVKILRGMDEEARAYIGMCDADDAAKDSATLLHAVRSLGDEEEFLRRLEDVLAELETDAARAKLLAGLGWKELQMRGAETARPLFDRAVGLDATVPQARAGTAWCLLYQGDAGAAEAEFAALAADNGPAGAGSPRIGLAAAAVARGRPGEAERICRDLLQAGPVTVDAARWASVALAEQGRLDEAEDFARRAAAMDSSRASLTQLAWVLVEGGRDLDEGLALARRAQQLEVPGIDPRARELPFLPSPEHCIGLALVKSGEVAEGVRVLEEAAGQRPGRTRIVTDLERARAL